LILLDRDGVDAAAVKRADERPVHALVEARIRGGRQARREKHEAAHATRNGLRRESVAIAPRDDRELRAAAEIAAADVLLRLGLVSVPERLDSFRLRAQ
jgi:hypothetical protein